MHTHEVNISWGLWELWPRPSLHRHLGSHIKVKWTCASRKSALIFSFSPTSPLFLHFTDTTNTHRWDSMGRRLPNELESSSFYKTALQLTGCRLSHFSITITITISCVRHQKWWQYITWRKSISKLWMWLCLSHQRCVWRMSQDWSYEICRKWPQTLGLQTEIHTRI